MGATSEGVGQPNQESEAIALDPGSLFLDCAECKIFLFASLSVSVSVPLSF